jgi:hypothetical protein
MVGLNDVRVRITRCPSTELFAAWWCMRIGRLPGFVWYADGQLKLPPKWLPPLQTWSHFPRRVRKKSPRKCGAFFLHCLVLSGLFVANRAFSNTRGAAIHRGAGCCFGCSGTASLGASARGAGGALCKCERSCKGEGRSQRNCFKSHGRFLLVIVQE